MAPAPVRAAEALGAIKRCRSLIAEAALLAELRRRGDVPGIFAGVFLDTAQQQIRDLAGDAEQDARVGDRLNAALVAMQEGDSGALWRIAGELKDLEGEDGQSR